jgi:acetylornithine deacetylase/succinyl-diaminopimelate desuccinylase-like protein
MILAAVLSAALAASQAAKAHVQQHHADIVGELTAFVALPNVASDHDGIEKNAAALVAMFGKRGVGARLLRPARKGDEDVNAPPIVVAEWGKGDRVISFYAHYDGQPVDAAQWATPPWSPVVKEGRLYGRSASDDKAPIVAMLTAIDAMKAAHLEPATRIRFVFEGEEEAGSPHLAKYLKQYATELRTDAWMICDGPVHQSGKLELYYGARGVTDVEITTYGPSRPLHSGHYGNWAPNPIVELTHLIDSMRDTEAKILIPRFYDDVTPLTAAERAAIAEFPDVDTALKHELYLGRTEGEGRALALQILAPALNLRGFDAGHVGAKASNAIPSSATASIDFRLVPAQTPEGVQHRVESFLTAQGWFIVHDTPDAATLLAHSRVVKMQWGAGYPAARTPLDSPFSTRVIHVIAEGTGTAPLRAPSLGGSVPMYLFMNGGQTPAIGLPIVNYDNNQHAANENVRIDYVERGVEIFAALFAGL